MTNRLNMCREAAEGICLSTAGESQAVTLGQIVLDTPVKGSGTHDVLPGHGLIVSHNFSLDTEQGFR
jgi:hypothetical protein